MGTSRDSFRAIKLLRLWKLYRINSGETLDLVVKRSKKSQVSVVKSSKLEGGLPKSKKVPSSRGYQRPKNNYSFSSYEDPKT